MPLRRSAIVLGLLGVWAAGISPAAAQKDGTMSFVIRDWFTAMYEGKFMDECPEGLNVGQDEYWWRGMTKERRAKITNNGLGSRGRLYYEIMDLGQNGEDVCLNPRSTVHPPLRVVEGKLGYGENLDGTEDGRATAKTCAHKKFTSPDGTKTGIDNQLYRLVGCTFGWRKSGMVELNANIERGNSGRGMILVEVTGVKDPRNSDNLTVTFYRSIDQFTYDGKAQPLAFSSYRIDAVDGKPRYGDSLKGRIKDGVLETERGDVHLPFAYSNNNTVPQVMKDMALHLKIAPDGSTAEGLMTGYYDVEQFMYGALTVGQVIQTGQFSCPSMYVAAHKLADGYPDPKTGECTALSAAFNVKAYAAFVLHPEKERRQAAR